MSGAKMLIVEDEWLVARGILQTLEKLGYEVVGQAVSGPEAIEQARATLPDLILMDIKLKGEMDGIEAAEQIRRQHNIPVVFLTAHADSSTLDRAKLIEPFGYLLKPFEERELHTAIEIALYKSRAEKRLQHLHQVLLAIRNVNQLIVQETDRDRLIQKACKLLTGDRGYYKAWIGLVDEENRVFACASEGSNYDTGQLLQLMQQGKLPECGYQALQQGETVVRENLSTTCLDCPILQKSRNRGSLITRLSHQENHYGILGVCLPSGLTQDQEELSLFEELAADIALALYKLDIEEREQRATERLKNMLDSISDGFFSLDNELVVTYFNKTAEKLLGRKSTEVLNINLFEAFPEVKGSIFEENFTRAIKEKQLIEFETYFGVKPYENWYDVRVYPYEEGISVYFQVITQRKQSEEAIKASEKKFRLLYDKAPLGYQSLDQDGRIIEVNQTWLDALGYTKEEVLGRWFGDFLSPNFLTLFPDRFACFKDLGEVTGIEFDMVTRDGSYKTVAFNGRISLDEQGNFQRTHCMFQDITEQKKIEGEKKQLEAQLVQAQKMEAIGTLAGGIAHDFNNILWAIMGFTELTLNSIPAGSREYHNLQQVLQAGERAKDLVNQILAFSRKTAHERKPLQLALIVQEAMRLLRATIPTTIEISTQITSPQAMVLADPTQMHQVIMNLCTNSTHAMQEKGGILEVKLEEKYLDKKNLSPYPDLSPGPFVVLTVSDTGHGIAPELLERIFDPFFTTKEVGEGTGMGLAVVYGIVKSHRGGITVASQPESGTTFTVLLPEVISEAAGVQAVLTPLPKGHGRILVVDDEKMLIELHKDMLESLGYEAVAQSSSLEALKIYQAQPDKFDLVITDQTMPHITGIQLASALRQIRPDLPIILCTGYSEKVSEEKIKEVGIDGLLMKPISLQNLAETVRQVLDKENR